MDTDLADHLRAMLDQAQRDLAAERIAHVATRMEAERAKQETATHAARLRREWAGRSMDLLVKDLVDSNAEFERQRDAARAEASALGRLAEVLAQAADAESKALRAEMQAVEDYLKPNCSNDMGWADEIIIAADQHALDNGPAWIAAEVAKGVDAMRGHWAAYRAFLEAKYPAKPGEPWRFTCPHHEALDAWLGDPVAPPAPKDPPAQGLPSL